ncbi:MAG: hypothetical protein WB699_09580 [Bacteroidota bacterium]
MSVQEVLHDKMQVLEYLRTRYPMFHQSNIFYRDVEYGIQSLLRAHNVQVPLRKAGTIAREFIKSMETEKVFLPVDRQTWTLNYPAFQTPQTQKGT